MDKLKPLSVMNFYKNIKPVGRGRGCWEWQGYCERRRWSKYGIISMNRKLYRAHRFSWMVHNGKIPKDLCVLHKCDNMKCVNPQHLFLGTRIDNNLDRDKKGRGSNGRKT